MIYLAIPIKHPDPLIESWRVQVATRAAASLHDAGIPVFSPATHGYGFAKLSSTRQGWDYWSKIDLPILLNCCSILAILELDGWKESEGVNSEILEASLLGRIPIAYIKWCSNCSCRLIDHSPTSSCIGYPSVISSVRHLVQSV